MKTNETRPVSIPPQSTCAEGKKAPAKRAFAKALEEAKPQPAPALPPMTSLAAPVEETLQTTNPLPPHSLDKLASEIGAALRVNDGKEVEIRFESKALAGLEARIRKEDGKLKVRLNCDSDSIRQMLSGHSAALAQRLETRGYAGVQVQVQSQPRPKAFRDSRGRSHSGQGQQQEQQKRRQR